MKIRFVKPWEVKQGDGKGPKYKIGDEVEFNGRVPETYARKYINRELAVEVTDTPAAPVAPAGPASEPATVEAPQESAAEGTSKPHFPRRVR